MTTATQGGGNYAAVGAGAQAVGGAVSLVGGYTQANAQRMAGRYQKQIADINAQISQLQAQDAKRRGDVQASLMLLRGNQQVGAQRASFGAGGADVNSGSALASQAGTQAISQLDALTISHNAALEAIGYNLQGANETAQGRMALIAAKTNANADLMTGGMKFGQSLMSATGNYMQYRPRVPISPAPGQGGGGMGAAANDEGWQFPAKEDEAPIDNGPGNAKEFTDDSYHYP